MSWHDAERYMMTLEKCVRTATIEHKNWKQELNKFLRQYRATPHSTTGISPCEALNQRKLKTTLPEVTPPVRQQSIVETQKNLAQRDAEQKKKIKAYADQKLGVRESNIKLGDTVLIKQPKANKLSTPFNPVPLVVEEKKRIDDYRKRWTQNRYAQLIDVQSCPQSHRAYWKPHTRDERRRFSKSPTTGNSGTGQDNKVFKPYCRPTTITKADKASCEICRLRFTCSRELDTRSMQWIFVTL